MMFKPGPEAWMSFLYGEMSPEEEKQMRAYLDKHPEAQAELEAFQQTRSLMQRVPEAPTPPIPNLIFQEKAKAKWFQNSWLHAVAAGLALLIAAKLIGVQVKFQDKTFSIQFGSPEVDKEKEELAQKIALLEIQNERLQRQYVPQQNDSLFKAVVDLGASLASIEKRNEQLATRISSPVWDEQKIADLKNDIGEANYEMVLSMLGETQKFQQAYTDQLLVDFSQFLEDQRRQDLKLMEVAFNHIIEQNDIQQEETQYLLNELMAQLGD
ncbi:MAG: hypothetical protein AAF696_09455 [Bacteroidota bacterium]